MGWRGGAGLKRFSIGGGFEIWTKNKGRFEKKNELV